LSYIGRDVQAEHSSRGSRVAATVAWCAGVLLALPVVALRYPPMADLALHESLVSLMRHFGDPHWLPPGVYALSFGPPNQLFHFVAWALSLALPTDLACKLVVAAAVVATPVAALRLARHLGTTPWSALLVAPLALGFAFRWGLVGNVLALPVVLASLPVLDRFVRSPSPRGAVASAGIMVLAYATHESALLALATAALTMTLAEARGIRGRPKAMLVRIAPLATAAALAAFYAWWGRHLKAPSILAVSDAFGAGPAARLLDVPGVLFGPIEPAARYGSLALYAAAVAAFVVARRRAGRGADMRFALVGATWGVLYLAMPLAFGGSTLLYQRFLPLSLAVLFVALAPPEATSMRPLVPLLGATVPLATLMVALPGFGTADRAFRDLDPILARVAPCSAVAQLDLTPRAPGPIAPVPGAGARVLAARGGRLLFSFTDAPTSPVTMLPAHQWNEPVLRMVRDPTQFRPAHDFRRFRYALVRLAPEYVALTPVVVAVMAPEGKLVAESGEWLLFESMLPVDPIDSPDVPLPLPAQESLRERLATGLPGR
jgi:hypothetical protein